MQFTREHEWIRIEDDCGVVGITDYAQQQLGDVVFVELPTPGAEIDQGNQAAVVESVKAASEVYAPASGIVLAVNDRINEDPSLVNSDPYGAGWFFKIQLRDPSELRSLLDETAYNEIVRGLS
jgi:glycine cleavage system H protein